MIVRTGAYAAISLGSITGTIEITLWEVVCIIGNNEVIEIVGHEVIGIAGIGHHNLVSMEHSITIGTRIRTIDTIDVLGNVHLRLVVDLEDRLSTHPDVRGAVHPQFLCDNTCTRIHLESVSVQIITQVDVESVIDRQLTVVDNIGATSSIVEIARMVVAIVLPSTVVAVDDGIVINYKVTTCNVEYVAGTLHGDIATSDIKSPFVDNL